MADFAEVYKAKFGDAPMPPPEESAYQKAWRAKFGGDPPASPQESHSSHFAAVDQTLANSAELARQLEGKFLTRGDVDAAGSIAGGLSQVPEGIAQGLNRLSPFQPLAMQGQQQQPDPTETITGGLHQAAGGAMTLAAPFMGAGLVAAPIRTAASLGAGMLGQEGTAAGLKKLGVSENKANFAGDVVGLITGGVVHGGLTGKGVAGESLSRPDAAFADAWSKKFGGTPPVEVPVAEGSSPSVSEAEKPVESQPAQASPQVGGSAKPRTRAENPFRSEPDEGVSQPAEVAPAETKAAIADTETPETETNPPEVETKPAKTEPKPLGPELVQKRPLVDADNKPVLTKAGKPRERTFGTKIDLEAQPDIAEAIDAGAEKRASERTAARGVEEAPEERSAKMREHIARLNDSIEAKEPLHMVYDSSKVDHEGLIDPAARENEHAARAEDPTLSQDAAKSFVPESYSVSGAKDVLVHGVSLDKRLSNGEKLLALAKEHKLRTPYDPASAGVEMALDVRKPVESLPKNKQNFWALANRESPDSVFQRALERRGVDPIDTLEQTKETLRLDRIEKILGQDEEPGVDAIRASAKSGTLKTPVQELEPKAKAAKAGAGVKRGTEVGPRIDTPSDLEAQLQASIEQAKARRAATAQSKPVEPDVSLTTTGRHSIEPAYGRAVNIAVPGESTIYKGRYALREASDVQASHNEQNFEPNPAYEHQNERDYSNPQNAARVVGNSSRDAFNPDFMLAESPTAEHGPTVVDARGNALGGNSRAMVVKRVYAQNGAVAGKYRAALEEKLPQYGISTDELQRFKDPVLVRERVGAVDAPKEVADYNKTAAADLTPSERAVADGKRMSNQTVDRIMAGLEHGDHESLADGLRGDNGGEILNHLERDGVISSQEKAGLVRNDQLTPEAKSRVAQALVGRMFESAKHLDTVSPELRGKLERIAPQVARVESREGWAITEKTREAIALIEDAKAHGQAKNIDGFFENKTLTGEAPREYSPEAVAIAKTMQKGQNAATMAFRRYANEEMNSRPGSPANMFGTSSQTEAFDDAFRKRGEKGSAPILTDLVQAVKDKIDKLKNGPDPGLKQDFSGVGALESQFVRNLGQLKRAVPDRVYSAVTRAASSSPQAAVKVIQSVPKIEKALGKDVSFVDFKRTLIQDRLNAIRDTWQDWARDAQSMSDKELVGSFDKGVNGLLWNMEGKDGLPGNLVQTAASMLDAANKAKPQFGQSPYQPLRDFLHNSFQDAAAGVKDIMPATEYAAHTNKPGFQKGLAVYKGELEPMLEQMHAKREGAFSAAKGDLDTYYPLEPLTPADKLSLQAWNQRQARINPFKGDANQRAGRSELGLGGEYDPASKVLKNRLTDAFRTNDRAAAVDALVRSKVIQEVTPGSEIGKAYEFNGTPLKATTMQVGFKNYLVPEAFARELKPILDVGSQLKDNGNAQKIGNAMNTVAISGPVDAVFHSKNLLGTLISRTPFIFKANMEGVGSVPIVKPFYQIAKLVTTDPLAPEHADALQWLARNGALSERFGNESYSKGLAEMTGGEVHRASLGAFLNGPKGIDVRARIRMYELSKILEPNASNRDRLEFVTQLGQYNKALAPSLERAVKSTSLSPFFTAGSTMNRNAFNTVALTGPDLGQRSIGAKVVNRVTSGAAGMLGIWALSYKAYTGKYPWQDEKSKLLKIPLNPEDRYSKLGRSLFGSGPEQGYIDLSFFNPLAGRGGRVVGAQGAYEAYVLGGSKTQMADAAEKDILNSISHPFMGPIPRTAFVAATGNEPYVTSLRDSSGRMSPSFWNASKDGSFTGRAKAAAHELNPFFGNLGVATGMLSAERKTDGNKWLRMAVDLAAPGLFGQPSNPYNKQKSLERQQRGIDRMQEEK